MTQDKGTGLLKSKEKKKAPAPKDAKKELVLKDKAAKKKAKKSIANPSPFQQINRINYDSVSSVVGSDIVVNGDITSGDTLRFEGTLKGNISLSGTLIVGRNALITGEIKAGTVHVIGIVEGDIHCEQLKIFSTGKITGDAYVQSIIVDEGAIFIGTCKTVETTSELPNIDDLLSAIN